MLDEVGKDCLDGILEDMFDCGITEVDSVISLFRERGLDIVKRSDDNAEE